MEIRSCFSKLSVSGVAAILLFALTRISDAQTLWTAQTGDWFTSTNWSDGVPDSGRNAQIINGGTAQILTGTANANNLSLGGGPSLESGTLLLTGPASLQVENTLFLSNRDNGILQILDGAQVRSGESEILGILRPIPGAPGVATVDGTGSSWITTSALSVGGSLTILNGGSVSSETATVSGDAVIDGSGSIWTIGQLTIFAQPLRSASLTVQNGGLLVSDDWAHISAYPGYSEVKVDGTGSHWENDFDQVQLNITYGSALSISSGGTVSTYALGVGSSGQVTVNGNDSALNIRTNLYVGGGDVGNGPEPGGIGVVQISNGGVINSPATTIFGQGALFADGVLTSQNVTVNLGGSLSGNGTVGGNITNDGNVEPGDSVGILTIGGNYTQSSTGVLTVEIGGTDSDAHDYLTVAGSATLDGTLEIRFVKGFLPMAGQVFNLVEVSGAVSGSFADVTFPDLRSGFQFRGEFVNGIYQLTALNDAAPAVGLQNISTRGRVAPGEDALIAGFIVGGSEEKQVIIRGLGPSLETNGMPLPGRLLDPTMELNDNTGALISSNDNWMDSPDRQQIIDSTIPPIDDNEAAIVARLAPGNYTAILRGVGSSSGIGIVEVYDLSPNADATLANISTRGLIGTTDNFLIGGFITGDQNTTVLLRALGPSLSFSGVENVLSNPALELYNLNGEVVASNNDWQDSDAVTIENTGLPPTDPVESAIVTTLGPGAFTAIVQGQNGATGVGLFEIYSLR